MLCDQSYIVDPQKANLLLPQKPETVPALVKTHSSNRESIKKVLLLVKVLILVSYGKPKFFVTFRFWEYRGDKWLWILIGFVVYIQSARLTSQGAKMKTL